MCELGSQGGMDGRWHCSAAQVEILLFQHADVLLFFSFVCVSIIMSACSVDRLKRWGQRGRDRRRGGGFFGAYIFYKLLWFIDVI